MTNTNHIPPGYKPSPLGPIPDDWEVKELGKLSEKIGSGITPTGGEQVYKKNGRYFLRSQNVGWGTLLMDDVAFIDDEIHNTFKSTEIKHEDVFLNITGASIGRSAVAEKSIVGGNVNQHVCIIRTKRDKLNPYFLNAFLLSQKGQNLINSYQAGGNRQGLNFEQIKSFKIPIPSSKEQTAIANLLSTWDKAIQTTTQLIAQKEQRKKWLVQQLLTGKKRLKGFSEEWKEVRLGELADKNKKWSFTGGPFGSNLKAEDYTNEGIRIIQLQNIGDGIFNDNYKIYTSEEKANELLSCNIYPGEIIISKMGDPVARACFMPNSSNRYLMASDGIRLAIEENKYNKKFIHDYINFDVFRKKAVESSTGSTRQRIGLDDLRKLTLIIPSLDEQTAIAAILQTADKEIQLLNAKAEQLKEQKKGLMQQLLTGKKRLKIK